MTHTILFMIHTVQSPQLYTLWPDDGPVQRPKHVVSLNKDNNIIMHLNLLPEAESSEVKSLKRSEKLSNVECSEVQ